MFSLMPPHSGKNLVHVAISGDALVTLAAAVSGIISILFQLWNTVLSPHSTAPRFHNLPLFIKTRLSTSFLTQYKNKKRKRGGRHVTYDASRERVKNIVFFLF